jgi:hypothetical protein
MQLAPIAPVALPTLRPTLAAPSAPSVPQRFAAAAAPSDAARGAAALFAPIIDFPGVTAGQAFDVQKGSKVGPLGVKGEAGITLFQPDHAAFHVHAGAFGIKVDVDVDIVQVDDTTVRISSHGSGVPDMSELGRVVTTRTNFAEFEQVSDPSKHTVISSDGAGHVTIDTVVPTFGTAHLELQRRSA